MHPYKQGPHGCPCTRTRPRPSLLALALTTSRVCSWLLPLYRLLQLVPAHPRFGHLHCLPWSLATRPWGIPEDPNRSSGPYRCPAGLTSNYAVGDMGPSSLSYGDIMSFWTHKTPYLVSCTTGPKTTACPLVPRPQVKVLPSRSPSLQSRRGDGFFKSADTYARLQGSGRIRKA